jgi:hypothetical protein
MDGFRESKFGWPALGVSIAEPVVVWGASGIIYALGRWGHGPLWLEDVFAISYLAGLGGVGLAILGLIRDSRRVPAGLALLLGIVNMVLCGLPLVSV